MKERKLYTIETDVVDMINTAAKIVGRSSSNFIEQTMKEKAKKIIVQHEKESKK